MAVRRRSDVSISFRLVPRPQEVESAWSILQAGRLRALRHLLDSTPGWQERVAMAPSERVGSAWDDRPDSESRSGLGI